MPRILAASRGARSLCMKMRIDDSKRVDNTDLGGLKRGKSNAETLRAQKREERRTQEGTIYRAPTIQFLRGLPVFRVWAMRSWVFFSPQRETKASRSRSRTYCSLTNCGEVSGPPARMFARLRPTFASYSEA